ncbi:MAG: type VI secretion system tip protein TssI/VgrG [Myxococcota bacterium]|nr:type VI secretion system tip protein TssI/VgrG [Myxococcota bacterium]
MSDDQDSGDDALETAGEVAEGASKLVDTVSKAAEGDVAGAVGSGAGALGSAAGIAGDALGDAGSEASEAAGEAQGAVGAASSALGAAQGFGNAAQSGDIGQASQALGGASDAARYLVPEGEAAEALQGVSQAAGLVQSGAEALGGAIDALSSLTGANRNPVDLHLEVAGFDARWSLRHVQLTESLNTVSSAVIEARYAEHPEARELLRAEVRLQAHRGERVRDFKGIVLHARVEEDHDEETVVTLHVSPAAALLGLEVNNVIHQDVSVVDAIKVTYEKFLTPLQRTVDVANLQRTYERREFIVQYQESYLAFISRLAEEEGIFFYFDHEGDREVLVLADSTQNLPMARADDEGQVHFYPDPDQAPDDETAFEIDHREVVGATDAMVRDYDWSNPTLDVVGDKTGRSSEEPAIGIYDHTDALIVHDWNGSQYGGNTASIQAGMRAERLDLDRQDWSMSTTVISAQPGKTLEVIGAPVGELDTRYLLVSVTSHGSATEGQSGTWSNSVQMTPVSRPYRPPRTTPRPVVHGPETAIVVGPEGEEIHTDEHGRVKVRFHWDRDHPPRHERSSCWMRVAHNWAGPGFGTFFLPRIDMEVVVSFLGGNPDRPLVTGCVYHGTNRVGVELHAKKTQSLIRTKSSPNSDGFNEMRFEDAAGNEFIYVHAQKDYNEEVEHDHSTHVKNCQSNSVDVNQTETVGKDQTMTVHGERKKTVDKDETNTVHQNRDTTIDGNDKEKVGGNRELSVAGDEQVTIDGNRKLTVTQKTSQTHKQDRSVDCGANDFLAVKGNAQTKVDGHYQLRQGGSETVFMDGHIYISSDSKLELQAPGCSLKMEAGKITLIADAGITLSSGNSTVELKSDGNISANGSTQVAVAGGGSSGEWSGSGVKQTGPMVEIAADAIAKINGTMVKIN